MSAPFATSIVSEDHSDSVIGLEVESKPDIHERLELSDVTSVKKVRHPFRRIANIGMRLTLPVVILALWQTLIWTKHLNIQLFSSPVQIAQTTWQQYRVEDLVGNIGISLRRAGLGLALGIGVGTLLGVISGLWKIGEIAFDASMQMVRTVPFAALTSLFIVWFGFGEMSKVLLIGMACSFPVYINVYQGIRHVDQKLIEMAKSVDTPTRGMVTKVVLPGALPQALVGFRFALSVSVLALVIAETINATSGIGYLLLNARQNGQTDIIFVCVLIYAVMGLLADLICRVVQRYLLAWHSGFGGA